MENDVEAPPEHKLCGYVNVVLSIDGDSNLLPLNSLCRIAGDPQNIHFVSQDDVVLTPIGKPGPPNSRTTPCAGSASKRRWSRFGMVHGSISVVHQIRALVRHKCVRILARVVKIAVRESEIDGECREARAVVLVDVYLPIALWSGWQFPKSASTAAALFKHLRFVVKLLVQFSKCPVLFVMLLYFDLSFPLLN